MRRWQEKKLLSYVKNYVARYHPFYRKLFREEKIDPWRMKSLSDFGKIPVVSKKDIVKDPASFILQPSVSGKKQRYDTLPLSFRHKIGVLRNALRDKNPFFAYSPVSFRGKVAEAGKNEFVPYNYVFSAGVTGVPSTSGITFWEFRNVYPELLASIAHTCGVTKGTRILNVFPAAPHIAYLSFTMLKHIVGFKSVDTGGGAVIPTYKQIMIADRMRFHALAGINSYVYHWVREALRLLEDKKINPLDFKFCLVGAEPLTEGYREVLKNRFSELGSGDCRILSGYGTTEMKAVFGECGEGTGLHLNPKFFLWECVDQKTGETVGEGEKGELVFSHIGFRGSVFLRFNTGDLLKKGIIWDKCEHCGEIVPRIVGTVERAKNDYAKIKGTLVNLVEAQDAVRDTAGVELFQIRLGKKDPCDKYSLDKVVLDVALKKKASKKKVLLAVRKNFKDQTEVGVDSVRVKTYDEIEESLMRRTRVKAEFVVDER